MITDAVTKTDFNSICYCVAFDSGLKNFWKCFFSREMVFSVQTLCVSNFLCISQMFILFNKFIVFNSLNKSCIMEINMIITFERNFGRLLSKYQTVLAESCFDLCFRKKIIYLSILGKCFHFKGHGWILSLTSSP